MRRDPDDDDVYPDDPDAFVDYSEHHDDGMNEALDADDVPLV
ncbi:hypothetical protein ACRAVF_27180 [Bradyrhizobium oligotrophicum S58]